MSQKKYKKPPMPHKRESILFFTKSCFKVAGLIFNYPNKDFHIRGIAKETKLSTTAVESAIEKLRDFGIVKIIPGNVVTSVRADLDSPPYSFYKKIFNLYRLERYNFIENLKNAMQAETIVLFGSFAKGEDIEQSDVDIMVITRSKPDTHITELIRIWEHELNRKVNLHVLPSLDGAKSEFKNSLANGIVLYGYLKVI